MNTRSATSATPTGRRGRWGFSPHWYLIYLVNLLFQPVFDPTATVADWLLAGAWILVGAVLSTIGARDVNRGRIRGIVALTAAGIVAVWFNAGAAVFFVYAAAFAGRLEPRTYAQRWILGLSGIVVVLALLSPVPMPYRLLTFGFPLVLVWMIGGEVMADAERQRESVRLRVDNQRIERLATLTERERIARDLHDLLGHSLTGVLVRAQLIRRLADSDPQRVVLEAADIEQIARNALAEVRSTVSGWRQHALDAEIDAARAGLAAAGVALDVEQDADLSLSPAVEAALALAVREAVTNVVRHARATTCTIGIVVSGDEVRLTVRDDGIGATAPEGSGLAGMRERITALGGQVRREVRRGTTLLVTVPSQEVSA
ncbi:MAG TPA: sensor histidine kinase [Euzebyales bacterium]|nr:sensor histidine kinase [Euzebyales bacterium]